MDALYCSEINCDMENRVVMNNFTLISPIMHSFLYNVLGQLIRVDELKNTLLSLS
jgi:hypothetical protein